MIREVWPYRIVQSICAYKYMACRVPVRLPDVLACLTDLGLARTVFIRSRLYYCNAFAYRSRSGCIHWLVIRDGILPCSGPCTYRSLYARHKNFCFCTSSTIIVFRSYHIKMRAFQKSFTLIGWVAAFATCESGLSKRYEQADVIQSIVQRATAGTNSIPRIRLQNF